MAMVNKIASMSPPTIKKQIQVFLGAVGFWRMHIPELDQIESPLYLMIQKMSYFKKGPEKQGFEQIKEEIVNAIALGSDRTGQDVKTVLSILQLGRMILPGVSAKKYQGTLEDDSWDSGVGDTKDPRPATQLKKGYWPPQKGFKLFQK